MLLGTNPQHEKIPGIISHRIGLVRLDWIGTSGTFCPVCKHHCRAYHIHDFSFCLKVLSSTSPDYVEGAAAKLRGTLKMSQSRTGRVSQPPLRKAEPKHLQLQNKFRLGACERKLNRSGQTDRTTGSFSS